MRRDFFGQLKNPAWVVKKIMPWIQGREVWDMGCGMHSHYVPELLLKHGAASVVSVDKEPLGPPISPNHDVRSGTLLQRVHGPVDVAFISWPLVPMYTTMPWLKTAKRVIYVGVNDTRTACYMPGLFLEAARREMLYSHSGRPGNMRRGVSQDILVVGERTSDDSFWPRTPTLPEIRILQTLMAMQRLGVDVVEDRIQKVPGA